VVACVDTSWIWAYDAGMFKAWFVAEAGWRHNRLHLILAAIAVVMLVSARDIGGMLIAFAIIGSLVARIYLWDLRRTESRLVLLRVPRQRRR
jgi:hypothetical protein